MAGEMVEQVAKALFVGPPESPPEVPWELLSEGAQGQYRVAARIAIEAMRNPSVQMILASQQAISNGQCAVWRTMIDSALNA